MEQVALNLARKWRSAQFKEIIGQELVVRILQNSLFKNQFFPVYLFSGQRGCGKTSTARVFAAAINCQKLSEFQKNPHIQIPCLQCPSCGAMVAGRHPDFIEIDAASYTGVDNIRNIIDTSSFLPALGGRKIYLIDEVHMLSKAAFNAFLKILEEPPKFVVFILATTEAQKLPDTVRSRCFQLFFNPIASSSMIDHLEHLCKQESIVYDNAGLELIAQVSQGSLRDAINLLEQARFADAKVSKTVVLSVLGYIDDSVMYQILMALIQKDQKALIDVFEKWSTRVISIEYVVKRSIELLYDILVIKYGGKPKYTDQIPESLQGVVEQGSIDELIACFDELCALDGVLAKTSKKQLLFESMMLRLVLSDHMHHDIAHDEKKNKKRVVEQPGVVDDQWGMFVKAVLAHVDPVLASVLLATDFLSFDQGQKVVRVATLKKFMLFQDLFIGQKKVYQEYLDRIFGFQVLLIVEFNKVDDGKRFERQRTSAPVESVSASTMPAPTQSSLSAMAGTATPVGHEKYGTTTQSTYYKREKSFDVSDVKKWTISNALLECFGGSVKEIIKDTHELDT